MIGVAPRNRTGITRFCRPVHNHSDRATFTGARDRNRTDMTVKSRDFKSLVSTYFTTLANLLVGREGIEPTSAGYEPEALNH